MTPEVSIIIRTKNEERWIFHCLEMLFRQTFKNFEIILVDNQSSDHTVQVASRYPLATVVAIDNYLPGLAINEGIRVAKGRFIVCLSAHCIPKDTNWLNSLYLNFAEDKDIAGVYGRQLPVSFTNAVDKRDLLLVFGLDRRVQIKDYFFHNANSMLRRDVWERFPFDEEATNIEDRIWGKAIIEAGYKIVYDPDAAVYHHHGLHQGNAPQRAKGVVSIIEKIDKDAWHALPFSLRPEQANVVAIVPVQGQPQEGSTSCTLIAECLETLKNARYVNSIYLVALDASLSERLGVNWIDRNVIPNVDELGVDELLQESLTHIESERNFPEVVLYVNHGYLDRPKGLFDELIKDILYKGYDTVFPGLVDYSHYWIKDAEGEYKQTDTSMKGREKRQPVFRALYGLGTASLSPFIRNGKFIGEKVGILPIKEDKYTERLRDSKSQEEAENIYPHGEFKAYA